MALLKLDDGRYVAVNVVESGAENSQVNNGSLDYFFCIDNSCLYPL